MVRFDCVLESRNVLLPFKQHKEAKLLPVRQQGMRYFGINLRYTRPVSTGVPADHLMRRILIVPLRLALLLMDGANVSNMP